MRHLIITSGFLIISLFSAGQELQQSNSSGETFLSKYYLNDANEQFDANESKMMLDCGTCSKEKHLKSVVNPTDIPVLSDKFAHNNKSFEMYFPGCHFSTQTNFCQKCMVQPANQHQFPYGTAVWQAFSVFIPKDYSHNPDWKLIYQFHGHPDNLGECDNWRNPPFAVFIHDTTHWKFTGKYSEIECDINPKSSVQHIDMGNSQPISKGGWSHFVLNIKFDYKGNGFCKVWLKDAENLTPIQLTDYKGPIGYNDTRAPYDYVSFGYYYNGSDHSDVKLYFDRIIFAGENESLESMMFEN